MTDTTNSNAFDSLTFAIGLLTVRLLGFQKGPCLASVDLLMLHCFFRLVVELEANRSAGHPLAGSSERRPQVHSLICVFVLTTPDLCQCNSGCLQLHHGCMVQCIGGWRCECLSPDT